MAEPSSSTAAGIVIATGTITLTGSIFGLQFDALLFGLFGGLVSLMFLPPDTPTLTTTGRTAAMLVAAAFLGALFSPAAPPLVYNALEFMKVVNAETIRLAAAASIGLSYQLLIPLGMRLLQARSAS